jgi:DNA-binding winged helix-turn-helix (wHTH) protein
VSESGRSIGRPTDVPTGSRYSFGGFEVDAGSRRITRDGEPVIVASRHLDVLLQLLSQPGLVVSKDALIESAWRGIAVTDNSLEQAISALRRALGGSVIATVPRQGYRFSVAVNRLPPRVSDSSLDALLAPHRAWIDGRAALESLERTEILRARDVFQGILDSVPDQPSAHIGLANACIMQFEMTRADKAPDAAARTLAEAHAREACRLDPDSGEAWATLAFVLERAGHPLDALAAVRRAVTLEPDNWRHHFRRAYVSWGEERLRAAQRTLALLPGFPLAHVLAASVHVARQALDDALREVAAGLAAEGGQHGRRERFSTVALHWLHGLLLFARGDREGAVSACERELRAESSGHLYAREFCANAWHTIGAIHVAQGDRKKASAAFLEALSRIEGHPSATVGLAFSRGLLPPTDAESAEPPAITAALGQLERRIPAVDLAIVRATVIVLAGQPARGAAGVEQALRNAPPGNAGWSLPIDPLIRPCDDPSSWASALACLQARAT